MRQTLGIIAVGMLALGTAQTSSAQTLAADMLKDFQAQRELIVGIADAMPAAMYDYKSTPAQRSYGEQVMHVIQVQQFLLESLGGTTSAPAMNMEATSKADIMTALNQSYDYGEAVFAEFDDGEWAAAVMGPRFLGEATRVRIGGFIMTHTMDIYGQMVVYLRLNGIVPPDSRREN